MPVSSFKVLSQRSRLPCLRASVILGTLPDQVKHVPFVLILQIAQVEARFVLGLPMVAARSAPPTSTLFEHETTIAGARPWSATFVPEAGTTLGYTFVGSEVLSLILHELIGLTCHEHGMGG